MSLLLGIDVGTSSTKALVIEASGRVIAVASDTHAIDTPRPGWSQQHPEWWWTSAVNAVRRVLAAVPGGGSSIRAVGLSGQMHGSVFLVGASGGGRTWDVTHPALLWNDQRTGAECDEIARAVGDRAALVRRVGNAPVTGFTLPKILWLKRHDAAAFARTRAVILPKDYVRVRLTGEIATDVGDASGTLLFDVDARRWDTELCALVGVDPALLPKVVESCAITGDVTAHAAAETGLRAGTPVVGGSGDNQCGAIGAGVVSDGVALAALGTSGVIYAHADRPRRDLPPPPATAGRLHTMCAADGDARAPGAWCVTGVMLSAAGSLQWVRDVLCPGETFESLVAEAETAPAGCDGLIFLPYLTGERCPYPDPDARGGWIGVTRAHTRAHLLRAVVEGVTFSMAQIVGLVRASGVGVRELRVGGGGARSAFWRQLQADLYDAPVAVPNTEEGPAFGAAMMAGVGAGVFPDLRSGCAQAIAITERREPSPRPAALEESRAMFERAYGATRSMRRGSDLE